MEPSEDLWDSQPICPTSSDPWEAVGQSTFLLLVIVKKIHCLKYLMSFLAVVSSTSHVVGSPWKPNVSSGSPESQWVSGSSPPDPWAAPASKPSQTSADRIWRSPRLETFFIPEEAEAQEKQPTSVFSPRAESPAGTFRHLLVPTRV